MKKYRQLCISDLTLKKFKQNYRSKKLHKILCQ